MADMSEPTVGPCRALDDIAADLRLAIADCDNAVSAEWNGRAALSKVVADTSRRCSELRQELLSAVVAPMAPRSVGLAYLPLQDPLPPPPAPPTPLPSDERVGLSVVKEVATELTAAADALDAAAAQIKNEGGKGYRANLAKQAALRARAAAQELTGGE